MTGVTEHTCLYVYIHTLSPVYELTSIWLFPRIIEKNYNFYLFFWQTPPDNHDGVIRARHLEPDILQCEVKWALESITTNKASGGDGIQLSYSKFWKMMLWKCCTQYASKFGKLSSGHRIGKGQFSTAKECSNYHTIALISHASKVMSKLSKPGFNVCELWTSRCSSWF